MITGMWDSAWLPVAFPHDIPFYEELAPQRDEKGRLYHFKGPNSGRNGQWPEKWVIISLFLVVS
jgi:hypothetical protein